MATATNTQHLPDDGSPDEEPRTDEAHGDHLHGSDGKVHLHMASRPAARPMVPQRWGVLLLAAAAVGLFAYSFFEPWWSFQLYAPQYPKGLKLVIALTGVTGDVKEINILNHYIGMKSLELAAPLERRLAAHGIAAIGALVVLFSVAAGKKLTKLVAVPAVAFPVIFLADSFYWLYKFGHELDPRAPLRIAAFTPTLFGNGEIGQFGTFAHPMLGFWAAAGGAALAIVAAAMRTKVCDACGKADNCGAACPSLLVLPRKDT